MPFVTPECCPDWKIGFRLAILVSFSIVGTLSADEFTNLEIREASRLENQLPEIAEMEVVIPDNDMERGAVLTQAFQPIVDHITGIPTNLLEEAAASFQRARVRLTSETRGKNQPFRIVEDLRKNLPKYQFRPLTVYGKLRSLRPLTPSDAENEPGQILGELSPVGATDQRLRILVQNIPEGLPTGAGLNVPVSATGFILPVKFAANRTEEVEKPSTEPLLIAAWLDWHQPAPNAELFTEVQDRTVGIKEVERFPMMKTLAHARLIEHEALVKLAADTWQQMQDEIQKEQAEISNPQARQRSEILFVDLFKNPDLYRGKAVTLTGTLRSLAKWPHADVNGFEIDDVYEARIFPDDGQSNPVIVNFLAKPQQIPVSDELNRPVQITGYFFKMYGYRDQADVLRVAPLFLAQKIESIQMPNTDLADEWILIVGGTILMLIVAFVVWTRFNDRQFQKDWQDRHEETGPDLSHLE